MLGARFSKNFTWYIQRVAELLRTCKLCSRRGMCCWHAVHCMGKVKNCRMRFAVLRCWMGARQTSQPVVQEWRRAPVNSAFILSNPSGESFHFSYWLLHDETQLNQKILHCAPFQNPLQNSLVFRGFLVASVFYRAEINASLMSLHVHCNTRFSQSSRILWCLKTRKYSAEMVK